MKITRRQLRQIIKEAVVKLGTKHGTEVYSSPGETDDDMALRLMGDEPYAIDDSEDLMDVGARDGISYPWNTAKSGSLNVILVEPIAIVKLLMDNVVAKKRR